MKKKHLILYVLLLIAVTAVTPWIGSEQTPPADVFDHLRGRPNPQGEIFFFQRLPRLLLALLTGGALAMVGASFQVLFRNPLVEPFTLGVSGGAALGAFLAISLPSLWIVWGPFSSVQILAVLGATGSLTLIYRIAKRPQGLSVHTLLLAGITISIICAGAILLLTYLASPNLLMSFQRWMMGGIDIIGYQDILSLLPFLLPGGLLLLIHARDLNHIALGEEMALGHGVDVRAVHRHVFIGGGLATAAVVSLTGPIGFVGLIIPHMVRSLSGYDQRLVLTGSFLFGGAVLALCDTLARTFLAPTELPVGIITALIGGPLFIRLLLSRRWR